MKAATKTVEARKQVQFKNILMATDFSANAQLALDYALAIARRYESTLFLAHVTRADTYQAIPQDAIVTSEWIRREAEEQMGQILISGMLRDVPHRALVEDGAVWPTLMRLIQQYEIDLVVVGTHGRTGLRKLALGSIAEEVFRMAPCPVLVVGPHTMTVPPREVSLRTIVYTTDLKRHSLPAADYALSLAQEYRAKLIFHLTVANVDDPTSENLRRIRESAEAEIRSLAPPETAAWCEPEFAITFGEPAESVLDLARARQADLIVMGARSNMLLASHRPPHTAYKIAAQAHCPVLTVRG